MKNNNMPMESEWRKGGATLASGALGSALGYPLFVNTAGLFILPMQAEFGWSRTAVSIGSIVGLLSVIVAPLTGLIVDRVGARMMGIIGLISVSLSFLGLGLVPPSQVVLYGLAGLILIFSACSGPMVFTRGIATWFNRHLGIAMGLSQTLLSVTYAILTPSLAYVIEEHGWRVGYFTLAALGGVLALPAVIAFFRESPKVVRHASGKSAGVAIPVSRAKDRNARECLSDVRFWILFVFFVAASMGIGGYFSQLVPVLVAEGFSVQRAASLASVYYISSAVGRILFGYLLDRTNPSAIAAGSMLAAAAGALLLGSVSAFGEAFAVQAVIVAVLLIGIAHGAEMDFIGFFIVRVFGMKSYATLHGILGGAGAGGGIAIGGLIFSVFHDWSGDYYFALLFSALSFVFSALTIVLFVIVNGKQNWARTRTAGS